MTDVVSILEDTIRWPEMSKDIVHALGENREEEFEAFLQRVEGRFRTTPRFRTVLQFMRDHSKLRDHELLSLFEFIYSSLINNLKGELAELFARSRIRDFAETVQIAGAQTILGSRLRERPRKRSRGWLKGADAIVGAYTPMSAEVCAVVEVKAMHHPLPRIVEQLDGHLERMRSGGLKIDDAVIPPGAITIRYPDGTTTLIASAMDVPALVIWPWVASEDGAILRHPERANVWVAELRYTQDELTEAAYRLADWFFARLAPEVFFRPGEDAAGRSPAPYPEDSLEENGRNAFRAALFGVWRRKVFQPRQADAPRGGKRTPGDTFLWLYNAICGGYEQANTDDIFFPEFVADAAYEERRKRWMAAREAFARNDYDAALVLLPDPRGQRDLFTRRREWLLKARVCASAGNARNAELAMEQAYAEGPSTNLAVPLERAATHALVAARAGNQEVAAIHLRTADDLLTQARKEIALHEREGFDYPADIDARGLETAVIDMAVVHTILGDAGTASALVRDLQPLDAVEGERLRNNAPPLANG